MVIKRKPKFIKVDERVVKPGTPEHEFRSARGESTIAVARGEKTPEEHAKQFLGEADPFVKRFPSEEEKVKTILKRDFPERDFPQFGIEGRSPVILPGAQAPQIIPTIEKVGFGEQVARIGVTPAVWTANLISKGLKELTGEDIGEITTEEFAETTIGRILGISTVIAGLVLTKAIAGKVIAAKLAGGTSVTKAAIIGKSPEVASLVTKFPGLGMKIASNPKTWGLTAKIFAGAGLGVGVIGLGIGILGTYPFASFGKEEALQTIGFPIKASLDAGDYEGAQMLLNKSNEIINAAPTISDKIPYLNVKKSFDDYVVAQATANIEWQRLIDERRRDQIGKGIFKSPFETQSPITR